MTTAEWREAPLRDVAEIARSGISPEHIQAGTTFVGLEHISGEGEVHNPQVIQKNEIKSTKFIFNSDHVLYGKLRPYLRKIARPNFQGVCSTDILPISTKSNLDRDYLFHYLRQDEMVRLAALRSSGANLPRISPKILADFPIRFPRCINEQRRIAAILDKADVIRAKRQQALALADDLLRATFLDMFGDPGANPRGYPARQLAEVADIRSGLTKGRKLGGKPSKFLPYMRVANVQDGFLDLSSIQEIEVALDEIERFELHRGDILLTEGGDPDKLGRGTIWKNEIKNCVHQNHIFSVRTITKDILPEVLIALIRSEHGRRYFMRAAKQTTGIATINKKQLSEFKVLLPPLSEQNLYNSKVERIQKFQCKLTCGIQNAELIFKSLSQRVFRGEF